MDDITKALPIAHLDILETFDTTWCGTEITAHENNVPSCMLEGLMTVTYFLLFLVSRLSFPQVDVIFPSTIGSFTLFQRPKKKESKNKNF